MGEFKLSFGKDEKGEFISYYDIWNLNPTGKGDISFFGKPMEIYGRVYVSPEQIKNLENN